MDHYELLLSIYAVSIFPDAVTVLCVEDLVSKQSSGSPIPLEADPPDGDFQAWGTVFGW